MRFHGLKLINKDQKGYTLIEMVMAIAVSGIIVAAVTSTIFQVIEGSARTSNHMVVVRHAQSAGSAVSRDAHMAQVVITDDDPGTPETELVTLTWTEWSGGTNTVIYTLDGTDLIRDKNGEQSAVAQFIESIAVDPIPYTGGVLTLTVKATVGNGSQEQSETRVYEIIPRAGS